MPFRAAKSRPGHIDPYAYAKSSIFFTELNKIYLEASKPLSGASGVLG